MPEPLTAMIAGARTPCVIRDFTTLSDLAETLATPGMSPDTIYLRGGVLNRESARALATRLIALALSSQPPDDLPPDDAFTVAVYETLDLPDLPSSLPVTGLPPLSDIDQE